MRRVARTIAAGVFLAAASWAAYSGITWIRYGRPKRPTPDEADPLLDRFMPIHEVAERHRIDVAAPAEITFDAAAHLDLLASKTIRAIFKSREWILGSESSRPAQPRPVIAWMKALGWAVLAEVPDREIVFGAVTRPWESQVVFRGVPPAEFDAFNEPGYVKIAWTLRVDPVTATRSVARTETRVTTTDAATRQKFRCYWAAFSPGMRLIRRISLRMVRREAERRVSELEPQTAEHLTPTQAGDA